MGVIKIGYLSFDASVKIHNSGRFTSTKTSKTGYGGTAGYIRHIDRGTDKRNGVEVGHSNPDINPDYTLENESFFKDENGIWQETKQSRDMVNAIDRRVNFAREHGARISTKGKNDTVIVRPLILQLDSDSITGHEDTWTWDVIEILEEQFGKDNIVGYSVHLDETNPHLHVAFVPCHETEKNGETKCTLSQTKFFQNPKQLAGLHKKIRKSLLDKGYEIELDNKPIDEILAGYTDKNGVFHQQGLTPDMLKSLNKKELNLRMEMINMKYRQSEMDVLEKALSDMMKSTKAKQEEMEKEREKEHNDFLSQQTALDNDRANVQAQLQALLLRELDVQKREAEVKEMVESTLATAEICSKILEEEKSLPPEFLDYLGKEGKKRGKPFREFVKSWYDNFKNEYSKKISEDNSNLQMNLKHCVNKLLKPKNAEMRGFPDTSNIQDYEFYM